MSEFSDHSSQQSIKMKFCLCFFLDLSQIATMGTCDKLLQFVKNVISNCSINLENLDMMSEDEAKNLLKQAYRTLASLPHKSDHDDLQIVKELLKEFSEDTIEIDGMDDEFLAEVSEIVLLLKKGMKRFQNEIKQLEEHIKIKYESAINE